MILIKSDEEIERIGEACRIVALTLDSLRALIVEGVTTREIERHAEDFIIKKGGRPAFKGYRGFPASICASVNSVVVHGIPSSKVKLRRGDIISIDLGVNFKGYFGDAAFTLPVGEVSDEAENLMKVTEEALERGMGKARAGNRVSDISNAVQSHVEANGYSVVRTFVGHGIGRFLHEDPQIPNFGLPGSGPRLRKGMTIAIEPMVNAGSSGVRVLDDGWTAVTEDGSLSAHFEHTVAVVGDAIKILTTLA